MTQTNVKTPYAKPSISPIHDAEHLIHAGDSKNGIDYYCPDCCGIVRKRTSHQGTPHFYHLNTEHGCSGGGLETTIHLLAKQVIEQEKKVWFPPVYVRFQYLNPFKDSDGIYKSIEGHNHPLAQEANNILNKCGVNKLYSSSFERLEEVPYPLKKFLHDKNLSLGYLHIPINHGVCEISNVRVEHNLDRIKPDIITTVAGRDYLIEVANTHFVDEEKKNKIKQLNFPCIEIDLSEIHSVNYETVKRRITQKNSLTCWIHFDMEKNFSGQFGAMQRAADEKYISKQIALDKLKKLEQERAEEQRKLEEELRYQRLEEERLEQERREREEARRQQEQERVKAESDRLKQRINDENDKWEKKGFPRFKLGFYFEVSLVVPVDTLNQFLQAIENRTKRVTTLGEDDLISKNLLSVDIWNRLEKDNELFIPIPPSLKSYHGSLVMEQVAEKAKEHLVAAMKIESEKGSGGCVPCPKCRCPGFKFEVIEAGESYKRRCVVKSCGHEVWFTTKNYIKG